MKMCNPTKKKKAITILLVLCLLLVYMMIFGFSSDNAQESSALSRAVMDFLIDVYYKLMGGRGEVVVVDPNAMSLEEIIRKMAHFAEYMAVGFLSFWIAVLWVERLYMGILAVTVQLIVSGALDELHQYFVPGRYASIKDVMIDTAGGIAGIILILMAIGVRRVWICIKKKI